MGFFFQGLSMGLAYVAPIGMQNLFVINAALTYPRRRALGTALIVVFFDITLALACFFGVGAVMARFPWLQKLILLVGSLIVLSIGVGLLRAKAEELAPSPGAASLRKTISSACVVTWFNPQAILDGTMMLGAFHVTLPAAQAVPFISGVATASLLWFPGLALLLSVFRDRFTPKVLRGINLACGLVILFYGGKLLFQFIQLL